MSGLVLEAPTAVDVSSTVAVWMPGPFVFTVLATIAVASMVAVMIYLAFVVGSGPDVLEEMEHESSAESGARTTDEEGSRAPAGDDAREPDEERDERRAESA